MFRITIINLALSLIDRFLIQKIKYSILRTYLQVNLNTIRDVTDVLTDENPKNNEQLAQLWEDKKESLINTSLDSAAAIILPD